MHILGEDYVLITIDYETYYGPKYSLSLGAMNTFSYIADEQFKIHMVGVKVEGTETDIYDFRDEMQVLEFKQFLKENTKRIALLAHNTQFDAFILHYYFDYHPDLYLDTMSMSRGMFVGQPASLKELAIRLWPNDPNMRKGDELVKTYGMRELPDNIHNATARYCEKDVDLCYEAFKLMLPYYPDDELWLIDWTIRAMCDPVLEVDKQLAQEEVDYQVASTKAILANSPLTASTLKSDKQFAYALTNRGVTLEYKRNAKDTDDIPALGQKDWGYLKMVARHPELHAIWAARKVSKSNIQESRARWFVKVAEWNNGKMPVPLNYYGADTGRWSGGEKLNLQNLPRNNNGDTITDPNSGRLRRSLLAPEGSMIVVRDLNNIEGRMLAWEADETYLLDLFRTGGCPYLYMAESIYNVQHGTFTKAANGGERNVGKVATLGLGYQMGANKFWVTVNTGPMGMEPIPMTFSEAQNVVNIYRATNSRIKLYWDMAGEMIMQMASLDIGATREFGPLTLMRNMAVLPNGMALQYPQLEGTPNHFGGYDFTFGNNKKIYGGLFVENITQALSRVLLGQQMKTIQTEMDNNYGKHYARIVHSIHDELVVCVPEAHAQETYDLMGDVMSRSPDWAPTLPLKSEGGIAREYSK